MLNTFGFLFLAVFSIGVFMSGAFLPIVGLVIGIKVLNVVYNNLVRAARNKREQKAKSANTENYHWPDAVRKKKPKMGRPVPVHMKKQVV